MQLDDPVTQSDFADLVGVSQQAIAAHVNAGTIPRSGTLREWLRAYTERLRQEAAGRVQSEARDRRDLAIAREAETRAALGERELARQDGLILDLASVEAAMCDWATVAKNEFQSAIDTIIAGIESKHAITVDRNVIQHEVDAALRAIGSYEIQPGSRGQAGEDDMDSDAAGTAD